MSGLATRHRLPESPGTHELGPEAGLSELGFALLRAPAGGEARLTLSEREALLVKLDGPPGDVRVDGERFTLPARASVFDDPPAAVYAPPGGVLAAAGPLLAGVFLAPADRAEAPAPYVVVPGEVAKVARGRANFAREVRDILPAERPAVRLLAGETISPPGNWSSSPPHKHDREAPPEERRLEEVYLYRVDPGQGFGLQLSYGGDPPSERAFPVADLDVVAIPAGYHPVVAGPGYRLYYLWGLAGSARDLRWFPDPAHAWVEGA